MLPPGGVFVSYLLVAARELPMCVDGLLELLLFSSSAVAKLSGRTNIKYYKVYCRIL